MIVGDVVDLECAGIDVAQHEIGSTGGVNWGDARELPIQSNRADESCAGDLIVVDVIDLQPAGIRVAQQQIGFAAASADEPRDNYPPAGTVTSRCLVGRRLLVKIHPMFEICLR